MNRTAPAALLALASIAAAQDPCEGNGLGNVYIETTPAFIGGTYEFDFGSPDLPFGLAILAWSDGFGPTTIPPVGTVCLDLSPAFTLLAVPLDGAGNAHIAAGIPGSPTLAGLTVFYLSPSVLNGPSIEIGKTVPVTFENADSFTPTGVLALGRSMHRATNLGGDPRDNRIQVFVSGGGTGNIFVTDSTNKTEIFNPLDRSFSAGPNMGQERAFHTATRLDDGRILITGGGDSTGNVLATCELYDHSTGLITSTGSMNAGRMGQTATLMSDGRVLVTGGLATYLSADTQLAAVLSTAQDSGEVYDPSTGGWTPVSNAMGSQRSGHTAELLADGTVLVISGIDGGVAGGPAGDVPTFTPTCDVYDPATNSFSATTPIPIGRAFHGSSTLGSGELLVTGGLITAGPFGEALATSTCYRFNGTTWTQTGSMLAGVAFHSQVATDSGNALVSGGYLGDFVTLIATATSGTHNGGGFTKLADVGKNPGLPTNPATPRGSHTMTKLWDGSFLLLGGFHSPDTSTILVRDDGFVYTPE